MSPKRRRLYVGLTIAGAGALFVDRALLSSSATAPASAGAAIVSQSRATGAKQDEASLDRAIPDLPFPRQIEPFDPRAGLRDLFMPPMATDNVSNNEGSDNGQQKIASLLQPGSLGYREFLAGHTLEAVFVDGGLRMAIVDGRWLQVGAKLSGCRIEDISGVEVRFVCDDGVATLSIVRRERGFQD